MNTGKNYNKLVYGSGVSKLKAKVSTLKTWLNHPKLKESQQKAKRSKIVHYTDFLSAVAIHGATLEDYFIFEFYNKKNKERATYVTGKKLHRFYDRVNYKMNTNVFKNKSNFVDAFSQYLGRETFKLNLDGSNISEALNWLSDKESVFVKKNSGTEGRGVERIVISDNNKDMIDYCLKNEFVLFEEPIVQHSEMSKLYSKSINTIRFITFVKNDTVEVLGATLRIGNGDYVDNAGRNGIYASIDIDTGELNSVAFNNVGDKFTKHPITNQIIKGFPIPCWEEVIEIGKRAALEVPDVRCVGWDIAISENGPLLIEGNDRFSRFLWQHPKEQGLYHLIK